MESLNTSSVERVGPVKKSLEIKLESEIENMANMIDKSNQMLEASAKCQNGKVEKIAVGHFTKKELS